MICYKNLLSILLLFLTTNIIAHERLIIEPDMGREPLLTSLTTAAQTVDIVMYGLTDPSMIQAIISAKNQDKKVRVLLQQFPYKTPNENQFAIKNLQAAHVNLRWPSDNFKLTHQKTFIIDNKFAEILTFNLTRSTFSKERNFALQIDNPAEVAEISRVFIADWNHQDVVTSSPNLIWSPNARPSFLKFIDHAQHEIIIYTEGLSDYKIIGALANAARRGVNVNILTSNYTHEQGNKKYDFLNRAGVDIRYSQYYIIHAKVIIIDEAAAILGSTNLTKASLDDNRELNIITRNPLIIHTLLRTFHHDWNMTSKKNIPRRREPNTAFVYLKEAKKIWHHINKHKLHQLIASWQ